MVMFIHFFCLCPLSLTIKLNFDISKVAYWRRGGLGVSALVPRSSGPGSSFNRGHSVVLLSQCLSPPRSINGYRRIVGET